jgi:tRNA A37 threonylcarbamoyladenosine synthetase subunit TsaC/SUA5/YrdC
VNPETFEHHEAVDEYAEAHGLAYVWEGTAAFEKLKRLLKPEQYQLMAVYTPKGVTLVLMFSKEIARAEARAALDTRLAMRKARYQKPL